MVHRFCSSKWSFFALGLHWVDINFLTIRFEVPEEYFFPIKVAAAAAKSLQSGPTLCDPMDGSPPGSLVPGILQARTLEWVAISCSHAWKRKVKVKSLSPVRLLATPWTAAHQAPPPMGFSRHEYWSGVPLPSPLSRLVGVKIVGKSLEVICYLLKPRAYNSGDFIHLLGQCSGIVLDLSTRCA